MRPVRGGWRRLGALAVAALLVAGCAGDVSGDLPNADSARATVTTSGADAASDPCGAPDSPGGLAVPDRDEKGWILRFTDDFNRCELGENWSTYTGQPGGNPNSRWDDSMVALEDGVLDLKAEQQADGWITGGVSNFPVTQLYGRWLVRMRADPSADISYHMLLWPQNETWPPEIDFAESVSGDRSEMSAFLHWVDAAGENAKTNAEIGGDFSQWHTVGVEWGPGIIRYLLDGKVWAQADSETMVPDIPMWLALQAEAGACERRVDWGMTPCTGVGELHPQDLSVEIDWVAVYEADLPTLETMNEEGEFDREPTTAELTDR